jgi:hypothetical protein
LEDTGFYWTFNPEIASNRCSHNVLVGEARSIDDVIIDDTVSINMGFFFAEGEIRLGRVYLKEICDCNIKNCKEIDKFFDT